MTVRISVVEKMCCARWRPSHRKAHANTLAWGKERGSRRDNPYSKKCETTSCFLWILTTVLTHRHPLQIIPKLKHHLSAFKCSSIVPSCVHVALVSSETLLLVKPASPVQYCLFVFIWPISGFLVSCRSLSLKIRPFLVAARGHDAVETWQRPRIS